MDLSLARSTNFMQSMILSSQVLMERVSKSVKVLPLYGALPLAQQDAAVRLDPTGESTHSSGLVHPCKS